MFRGDYENATAKGSIGITGDEQIKATLELGHKYCQRLYNFVRRPGSRKAVVLFLQNYCDGISESESAGVAFESPPSPLPSPLPSPSPSPSSDLYRVFGSIDLSEWKLDNKKIYTPKNNPFVPGTYFDARRLSYHFDD